MSLYTIEDIKEEFLFLDDEIGEIIRTLNGQHFDFSSGFFNNAAHSSIKLVHFFCFVHQFLLNDSIDLVKEIDGRPRDYVLIKLEPQYIPSYEKNTNLEKIVKNLETNRMKKIIQTDDIVSYIFDLESYGIRFNGFNVTFLDSIVNNFFVTTT